MSVNVLIATDGSDGAIAAGRYALAILAPDARLTMLAVVDPPNVPIVGPQSLTGGHVPDFRSMEQVWLAQRSEAESAVEATVAALGLDTAETRVESGGDASSVICSVAAELGADVIVVGQRGLGFVRRALLGSVSSRVVQNAGCAVLVVRHQT
jgi:nucleotide-binding universal stress UspA family protein